jgi:hypothetical protein
VGVLDVWCPDYTLMMLIIKGLTLKLTFVIIVEFELAKPGETKTSDRCEPP